MSGGEQNLSLEDVLRGYELLYERTGNPLFAWSAYYRCRLAREEIPEWVFRYLDRASHNLMGLSAAEKPPKKVAPAVSEALEMEKPGKSGRGNVFKKLRDRSELNMSKDMLSYLNDGNKPTQAAEYAAVDHGVHKSTVNRTVTKYFPGLLRGRDNGFELLRDKSNLDIALDVASYIEDGHERGLPIESLAGMAFEYVAVNHNVSISTVACAFEKYFPKKKYWTNLSSSK